MKKIFSLLAILAFASLANAEIYEGESNDNAITLSTDGVDQGDVVINIDLANPTASISGMDVYLDFSGGNDKISTDYVLADARCKSGRSWTHSATTGINKNAGELEGLYFIGINSSTNTAMKDTEGTVASIFITGLEDGQYTLKMAYGICFNVADKYICEPAELVFTLENGTVTGINGISVDAQNAKYYSVNGAIQNGPQKGVNIVKYANGEVKKVIVK